MSRTYKEHLHHAGRDNWKLVKERNKKKGNRSEINYLLKNFNEDIDFKKPISKTKKSSSGYGVSEKEVKKWFLQTKQSLLNGFKFTHFGGPMFGKGANKKIISKYCELNNISLPHYDGNNPDEAYNVNVKRHHIEDNILVKAITELSENIIFEIIHSECSSKGL